MALVATAMMLAAACTSGPADRRPAVDDLTRQLGAMPGVVGARHTFSDDPARGPAYFEIDVDVDQNVTADQLSAITGRYLDNLQRVDYAGYRAELDVHRGDGLLLVDTTGRPVANRDQILAQARSWVALGERFPGSTIKLRATTSHADGKAPVPNSGSIQLPDGSDYTAVTAAVSTLAASFADLTTGEWTINAGTQHPAEVHTSQRLPNPSEMELWTALNADQSIPHADVFTINGPVTGPLFVSEKIPADDPDTALRLAERHLPIVARLPPLVLYTATNQYQGHLGFYGQATGPVTVAVGGCVRRTYQPPPVEQALIDKYQSCPGPAPR
ncbi:MAG: hypothetical protein QOH57_1419 [Mycobacterium sp.]|nr:hypothetical protein [Mycobacterium sp.]